MGSAADIDPRADIFFRETLTNLGRELGALGGHVIAQTRMTHQLISVTEEMVTTGKDLAGAVRELTSELRSSRERRRPATSVPPLSVATARTKTGG